MYAVWFTEYDHAKYKEKSRIKFPQTLQVCKIKKNNKHA